jgi:hypothetical protein
MMRGGEARGNFYSAGAGRRDREEVSAMATSACVGALMSAMMVTLSVSTGLPVNIVFFLETNYL